MRPRLLTAHLLPSTAQSHRLAQPVVVVRVGAGSELKCQLVGGARGNLGPSVVGGGGVVGSKEDASAPLERHIHEAGVVLAADHLTARCLDNVLLRALYTAVQHN